MSATSRGNGGRVMNDCHVNPEPIPEPIQETDQNHLPAALTFFLPRNQRTQILRALKAIDPNRVAALLPALQVDSK